MLNDCLIRGRGKEAACTYRGHLVSTRYKFDNVYVLDLEFKEPGDVTAFKPKTTKDFEEFAAQSSDNSLED